MIKKVEIFLNEMDIVSGIASHENFITFLIDTAEISDNKTLSDQEFKAFENNFRSVLKEFNILDNNKISLKIDDYVEDQVCFILTLEES